MKLTVKGHAVFNSQNIRVQYVYSLISQQTYTYITFLISYNEYVLLLK